MKRLRIILLVLLLCMSFVGCANQDAVYTVSRNGIEFRVDSEQRTISDGSNIYHYELSGNSSSYQMVITYPNGASYWFCQSGNTGNGGWSDDYNEELYVSGNTLVDIVQKQIPKRINVGKIIVSLLLVAVGIFDMAAPQISWYLGYGWRYKNAEPSDAALIFARVGGGIAVLVGIVLLLS